VLGKYVREEKVLTLPEAIKKMTSLPAQTFGLQTKGVLRSGLDADIVIFDPRKIIDKATYDDPIQPPEGIHYVIVNGEVALQNGELTGAAAGRVLKYRK
jgi:N-acyl-D-amino-acid deacylase